MLDASEVAPRSAVPSAAAAGPYAATVRAALLDRLPAGEPQRYLYDLLPAYPQRGGKSIRSTFLIGTCAALGGREERALGFGVGIELLHNAFLVHDDIQDGSPLRRGEPTLAVEYGNGLALCVGNALALEALVAMQSAAADTGVDQRTVLTEVNQAIRRTLEGQAQELGWQHERRLDVSVADYLDMVVRKTAWYSVILPCRLGVLVAKGSVDAEAFIGFGALTGAVLQIADDVQSLLAPEVVTGKEPRDDLVERKRSLPIIHALSVAGSADRRRLERMLVTTRTPNPDALSWAVDLMQRTGSIEYARQSAIALAEAAREELATEMSAAVSPRHVEMVEGILDLFIAACG